MWFHSIDGPEGSISLAEVQVYVIEGGKAMIRFDYVRTEISVKDGKAKARTHSGSNQGTYEHAVEDVRKATGVAKDKAVEWIDRLVKENQDITRTRHLPEDSY